MSKQEPQLSLETFSAERAEVAQMAEKHKGLKITGVEDRKGYEAVDAARKELKAARVRVQKTGKELRDDANQFAKKVIEVEKDIISLIEPTERQLEAMQDEIDKQKERLRRAELLPGRKERLAAINAKATDEELLDMDIPTFETFFNEKNAEYLAEERRKLEEERQKVEEERRKAEQEKLEAEAEKKRLEDLETARKEAAETAKKEAEAEKQRAITAEREREEREKKEAVAKVAAEREKLMADLGVDYVSRDLGSMSEHDFQVVYNAAKKMKDDEEAEKKAAEEKAEADRLAKRKQYTDWLEKHGYTEETKGEFYIQREGDTFTIYKKLGAITIK